MIGVCVMSPWATRRASARPAAVGLTPARRAASRAEETPRGDRDRAASTWALSAHWSPWPSSWDGGGVATDGQPYENSYAWIMKLADGKVIDGAAFYDSLSFNDLWARVQPR